MNKVLYKFWLWLGMRFGVLKYHNIDVQGNILDVRKRLEDVLLKINKRHYRFKEIEVYEKIGIKTYNSGEGFKWHGDGIPLRRFTAIVFLNNDYTGGDLRAFCGEEVVIKNNIGVLVVFPSWYFHQADEVLSGERKVLITFLTGPLCLINPSNVSIVRFKPLNL